MNTGNANAALLNTGIRPALQAGKRFCQTEIRQFLSFVLAPRRSYPDRNNARANGLGRLACLLCFGLLLSMLDLIPMQLGEWAGVQSLREFEPKLGDMLLTVGFAPLIEEWLFRAGLRNSRYTLVFGPLTISLFTGAWQLALALPLIWGALLLWHRLSGRNGSTAAARAAQHFAAGREYLQRYPLIFHLYAVGFALLHIQNYFVTSRIGLILLPLMVLPQWLAGLMYGYLRIRHSLKMAILAHMSWNGLCMILGCLGTLY